MNPHDSAYAKLVTKIMANGVDKGDRTGTGTRSLFGKSVKFDMEEGFPLLTLKHTPFRWIAEELFWFIQGDRRVDTRSLNEHNLRDKGVSIWEPWADSDGELGPVYGVQWRSWRGSDGTIDQLKEVERKLFTNPDDRRMIVSAWNPAEIDDMALPPCHLMFQCYSRPDDLNDEDRYLDMQMYQRSCDMFLGVPFNIASYALLVYLLAHSTGHRPGVLTWVGGDCHVYHNHFDQVYEMLGRSPYAPPRLYMTCMPKPVQHYTYDDLHLTGYQSHDKIGAEVAV